MKTTVTIGGQTLTGTVLSYTADPPGAYVLVRNRKRRLVVWRPRMGDVIAREG